MSVEESFPRFPHGGGHNQCHHIIVNTRLDSTDFIHLVLVDEYFKCVSTQNIEILKKKLSRCTLPKLSSLQELYQVY